MNEKESPNINENSFIFIESLKNIYSDELIDNRNKFFLLYKLLTELISSITDRENQYINSDYAKFEFIINKYKFSAELSNSLHSIRNYTNKLSKDSSKKINQNSINTISKLIVQLYKVLYYDFSDVFTDKILDISTKKLPFQKNAITSETVNLYSAIVVKKYEEKIDDSEHSYLLDVFYNEEIFSLLLNNEWEDIYKYSNESSNLNIINISILNGNKIELNRKSFIVLEPDFLFDVTDLASSIDASNKYSYFFNLILPKKSNISLLKGNIINNIFDELIINPEATFEELYEQSIKSRPISLYALSKTNKEDVKLLKPELSNYFSNIKQFIENIESSNSIIEPSFISPKWGMQGRLDLLIEDDKDENLKDIIELKSGKFPNINMTLGTGKNTFRAGMWSSHYAQVSCYNMILSSVYPDRKGNSSIYYAMCTTEPNRNAAINENYYREIVKLRNNLVFELIKLSKNKAPSIENYFEDLSGLPKYKIYDVNNFYEIYINSSDLEKNYYNKLLNFLLKELLSDIISNSNNSITSDLWKLNIDEKKEKALVIDNLNLLSEKSDFEKLHLFFQRNDDSFYIDSFRRGDIVIVYQKTDDFQTPVNDIILKGSIKEIDNKNIIITIRNKSYPIKNFFKKIGNWVIERDQSDSNTKKLIPNLSEFLYCDDEKKKIILGVKAPRIRDEKIYIHYKELTDNQNEVLNEILNSNDYYLLQGPPGTGKTSYVIRYLVKYLIEHTSENILLIAYTNRALDEICNVINKLGFDYLRLGNKESSIHQDHLLCNMVESNDFRNLYKKINKFKIVASTVFSAVNNFEIFDIWDFDTIIVDEASQILEPQIVGTLCKAKRFILIGDEKQLPAITSQTSALDSELDKDLIDIGFQSMSNSIFERMLRNIVHRNWNYATGNLYKQARMHRDVQEFPNVYFYNSKLEILDIENHQSKDFNMFENDFEDNLIDEISKKRFVFINSKREKAIKYNISEAELSLRIIQNYIKALGENLTEKSIGVISPFRAQCAIIAKYLEGAISSDDLKKITIDTVERYQGSERDIIIYSFATNYHSLIEKISSRTYLFNQYIDRKLNVALTRAKEQIIILGCDEILSKDEIYRNLVAHSKKVNGYYIA